MQRFMLFIALSVLGLNLNAFSQQGGSAEQQLAWHLKHIQYWRFDYAPDDTSFKIDVNAEDSIAGANKMMLNYLLDMANNQPASIRTVFKSPDVAELKVVTSDDNKLRFYSWNTQTGMGVTNYDIVAQYETTTGGTKAVVVNDISKFTGDAPDPGVEYTGISTVNSSRKKYYIAMYAGTAKNTNMMKGVHAYYIEGDKLVDAPIFQGLYETKAKVEYSYDQSANYDFKKMKEDHTLRLDKQRLYIPEVANDKITGNYMVYVYDGEKFVYDKNAK